MKLATRDDYDLPNIDWLCKECGEVYCSAGYPPETRCMEGHGVGWKPDPRQVREYIDVLESLEPGDWLVLVGDGPAPLMGPVESVGERSLTMKKLDSPSRSIRWGRGDDEPYIGWEKVNDEFATTADVHHVEQTDARPVTTSVTNRVTTPIDDLVHDAAEAAGIDPDETSVDGVRMVDGELEITLKREVPA